MSKLYTRCCQVLAPLLILAGLYVAISDPGTRAREYYADERGTLRRYSRAVITEGGRTVWLAGQTTLEDAQGNPIADDFDAQLRENFRLIGAHLEELGGSVRDIVTMTVYATDVTNADSYVAIKAEVFGDGPYPSSAWIGAVGFSRPGVVVEVKAIAVIDD